MESKKEKEAKEDVPMTDAEEPVSESAAASQEAKPNGVAEAEPTSQPMETETASSKPAVSLHLHSFQKVNQF